MALQEIRQITHTLRQQKKHKYCTKKIKTKTDQEVDTSRNLFGYPRTHFARRKMQKISEKIKKNPTKWLTLEEIRHQDPRIHTAPENISSDIVHSTFDISTIVFKRRLHCLL